MPKRKGANKRRMMAASAMRRKKTASKLRFGAVVRFIKTITAAAVLIAVAVFGAGRASAFMKRSEAFVIDKISVRGISLLDTVDVVSGTGLVKGAQMTSLNTRALKAALMKIPSVNSADVRRGRGGQIDVSVKERTPVAMFNKGEICLVDRGGALFPIKPGVCYDIPVVSGLRDTVMPNGNTYLTAQSRRRMLDLLDGAKQAGYGHSKGISQAVFSRYGITVRFEATPVAVVIANSHIPGNLERLRRITEIRRRQGLAEPQRIDLRYNNCAFVREAVVLDEKPCSEAEVKKDVTGGDNG